MWVDLLGPLRVGTEAGEIEIRAAKERAVLARLALEAERTVGVDALIDALWGDDAPVTAVKTLQNYVARLRRVLPDGTLESRDGGYRLSTGSGGVDLHRFEAAAEAGRRAWRDEDVAAACASFTEALALWRGAPVPDLADRPVGTVEAARLNERRAEIEEALADARLARGEHAALVPDLEAAVRAEPLREARWAQLMLALYRSGRQADALRAYQRARSLLIDELGIEPGTRLRELEQAIIDQADGLRAEEPIGRPRSRQIATRVAVPPTVAAIAGAPLFGRDPEDGQLAAAWSRAGQGSAELVVVSGEPGIGKTRLLGHAAHLAHADGGFVLFGRCDPEAIVPYQPFADSLGWFARSRPAPVVRRAFGRGATELARLAPEIARRLDLDPPEDPDPAARHRLFDAVAAFLEHEADDRPVLLAIDDLQWADAATVVLLRHLLRTLAGTRLLVVVTARDHDPVASPVPVEPSSLAPPEVPVLVVPLAGLADDAVRAMLALDDDAAVASVQRASGGSPLFLREIQRHASVTGRLAGEQELPAGVRQAVDRRLAGLSGRARRLLGVASVAGAVFRFSTVVAAAECREDEAGEAIDEAVRAHVLAEEPDEPGTLAFSHAIVRAAVYQELSATRRTYLHARIARSLLAAVDAGAVLPDRRTAELAYHLDAAHPDAVDADAAIWSVRAARAAGRAQAWEAAASHLERALVHLPADDPRSRVEVLVELATAERGAARASAAKERFVEALALGRTLGDPELVAETALAWASVPVDVRRELHEVIDTLRAVADDLPAVDGALRALVLGRMAFSMGWANLPDARATSDEAIAMARRVGDDDVLAQVLQWAESTRTAFELAAPGGCHDESLRLTAHRHDPEHATHAALRRLLRAVHVGDRDAADAALADALARLAEASLPDVALRVAKAQGDLWVLDGDLGAADARASELFDQAARHDVRNLWLYASSLLYDVRRAQGRLGELAPWFDRVADRGERVPKVGAMRVEVLAAVGRTDDAVDALDAFLVTSFADLAPIERPYSLSTMATVAADLGLADRADVLAGELTPYAGHIEYGGDTGGRPAIDLHLGRLALLAGRYDEAAAHLATARDLHTRLRAPLLLAASDAAERDLSLAR